MHTNQYKKKTIGRNMAKSMELNSTFLVKFNRLLALSFNFGVTHHSDLYQFLSRGKNYVNTGIFLHENRLLSLIQNQKSKDIFRQRRTQLSPTIRKNIRYSVALISLTLICFYEL